MPPCHGDTVQTCKNYFHGVHENNLAHLDNTHFKGLASLRQHNIFRQLDYVCLFEITVSDRHLRPEIILYEMLIMLIISIKVILIHMISIKLFTAIQ